MQRLDVELAKRKSQGLFDNDKNRRNIVLGYPGHPLLGVDPIETAVSLLIRLKRLSIARADGAATLKL